ncbi:aldehyde dehydrogenase (NADP(+)) [Amycolatopsis thermoflava]|uniref:NADP-dependent aldehyde dehydrogenase n=1 Tax=Amycolatopsis thermoflava TaxID=84480 RepID=A0A3N2GQG8_9PSEU|nr:aldehyde dehydrogenase (NADP(+)) [Amycolatopsis thermoflava]ROS38469.1 NADP-dependent aldehyde dehydrogenase [Amycolatopsis thermoflava]
MIATTVPDVATAAGTAASAWAATPHHHRARALDGIAAALEDDVTGIVEVAAAETSLGRDRITSELARTTFQLRLFADLVREGAHLRTVVSRADPQAPVAPRPDLRRTLVPIGPVAVFAAGNFPLAFSVAGTDTASALAAGCPVVVKVNPGHPRTSDRVARLVTVALRDAGAPDGVFAIVHGFAAGAELVSHPAISAATFTGSVRGGRALFDLAAARPVPIPFFGELGSLNSLTVTAAAARDRGAEIAADLAASVLLGGGQFCTKPGLVLLPRTPEGARVETELARLVAAAPAVILLDDHVHDGFAASCRALEADDRVRLLAAGGVAAGAATPALYAVEGAPLPDVALEECFGPAVVVASYADDAELLTLAGGLPGALTATVHSQAEDSDLLTRLVATLAPRVGRLVFDQYPTGVAVDPAMQHGGPYPSSTDPRFGSVGTAAIDRFLRPIAYQNAPPSILPRELQN